MFLRIPTKKSMKNYSDEIIHLKEKLDKADAVVIGAGAGLSTAAGFTYAGERFEKHFSDFKQKYGFTDMYSADFTRLKHLKNTGRIGADTSTSTAIWIYRIIYMI